MAARRVQYCQPVSRTEHGETIEAEGMARAPTFHDPGVNALMLAERLTGEV